MFLICKSVLCLPVGGLKLWECAVDLVETLRREIQDGQLSFRGKRVLELGCGHGLPGILACIKGATSVDFQDFNAEVLRSLTIHNVNVNLEQARSRLAKVTSDGTTQSKGLSIAPDVHYYAGDWGDVHKVLSVVPSGSPQNGNAVDAFNFTFTESDLLATEQESDMGDVISQVSRNRAGRRMSGSRACERGNSDSAQEGGYDIILMSDTVYSMASLPKLYGLIKKVLLKFSLRPLFSAHFH
jgi:predicted nicotinamide N-methyase